MLSKGYQTNSQPSRKITEIRGGGGGSGGGGGGVYDKHPLELGGLQQKCPPWEVWIFFGTTQGGLPWHLQRFFIKWLFLVFSHRRFIKVC